MNSLKKDIGIYYKGGCGGFFTFFYILGLSLNLEARVKSKFTHKFLKISKIPIGTIEKTVDFIFYKNFLILEDLKLWKNYEHVTYHNFQNKKNFKKLFLYCFPNQEEEKIKNLDCIKINPYIADNKKWRRIQYEKRCYNYFNFSKKDYSYKTFFNYNKKILAKKENSRIDYCDYSFDFIEFIYSIKERKKFCNFLNTNITEKSEEYLKHYIKCNKKLTKYLK